DAAVRFLPQLQARTASPLMPQCAVPEKHRETPIGVLGWAVPQAGRPSTYPAYPKAQLQKHKRSTGSLVNRARYLRALVERSRGYGRHEELNPIAKTGSKRSFPTE